MFPLSFFANTRFKEENKRKKFSFDKFPVICTFIYLYIPRLLELIIYGILIFSKEWLLPSRRDKLWVFMDFYLPGIEVDIWTPPPPFRLIYGLISSAQDSFHFNAYLIHWIHWIRTLNTLDPDPGYTGSGSRL